MEQVNYINLVSSVRNNILKIIQDNIQDPLSSNSRTRKWIYSRLPDTKSRDFSGFPYIVIPSPEISFTEQQSVDITKGYVTWNTEIIIHSSDRGWKNQNGRGLELTNTLSNQIMALFLNRHIKQSFQDKGMFFCRPEISKIDIISRDNILLYEVSVFLSFSSRMVISN